MHSRPSPGWILVPAALLALLLTGGRAADKSHALAAVSLRKFADSLHAVIAADRQVYSRLIVERLDTGDPRLAATTDWRERHGLPVHAQMLRSAAADIQRQGAEFSYTLRSLWPINPQHGPQTEVETVGLKSVAQDPGTNYYTRETLGGRSYFTAVYPDRATLRSCVECHNHHPASPRHDFKPDDVMGAIVVRVPLEF